MIPCFEFCSKNQRLKCTHEGNGRCLLPKEIEEKKMFEINKKEQP
jgi:hypothetical protein